MHLTASYLLFDPARYAPITPRGRSRRLRVLLAAGGLVVAAAAAGACALSADPAMAAFTAENDVAMAKMMRDMHVHSSGNVDRDFAVMMMAHHQGAVDMALAELKHGRNQRLKRLASEIVVEQRAEIVAMQAVLDEELSMPAHAATRRLP